MGQEGISRPITPDIVMHATVDASGLGLLELIGKGRSRYLIVWRFAAMHIASTHGASYPKIGRAMCRDHTSVMHGAAKHREAIAMEDEAAVSCEVAIRGVLAGGVPSTALRHNHLKREHPRPEHLGETFPALTDEDNERYAVALVAAHPEMVLHLMRREALARGVR